MAMPISTLEILEQSQMPPAYARAIAKAFEADGAQRREELVTKSDLRDAMGGLHNEMGGLRHELKKDMAELKSELRIEIHAVKSDLVRWLVVATMAQAALLSGATQFLISQVR